MHFFISTLLIFLFFHQNQVSAQPLIFRCRDENYVEKLKKFEKHKFSENDLNGYIPKNDVQFEILFYVDAEIYCYDKSINYRAIQDVLYRNLITTSDSTFIVTFLSNAVFADGYVAENYFGWVNEAFKKNKYVKIYWNSDIQTFFPAAYYRLKDFPTDEDY